MTETQVTEPSQNPRYQSWEAQHGRPSEYSDEIAQEICDKLADGQSLREICEEQGIPRRSTIYNWLEAHPSFMDRYLRARNWQAESHADDIVYIVDKEDDPRKAQVRMNGRIWHASKMNPKKYGDHKHLSVEATLTLDDKQLDQRLKALASQAGMTIDADCQEVTDLTPIEDKT